MDDLTTETSDSVSMDQTIADTWSNIQSGETDDTSVQNDDPGTPETPEQPEQQIQAVEAKKSPVSWTKDIADKHWGKLSPDLQDEILRREEAFGKGIEKYRTSAQIGDAFTEIVRPYMGNIEAAGVDPGIAVNHLLQTENVLRNGSPEQKANLVLNIFRDYKIDPKAVFGMLENAPKVDPQVQELTQRLNAIEGQRQREAQNAQMQSMQQASTELAKFSEGKPHFEQVRGIMADLLDSGSAKDLQEAYDMATFANPTIRAELLAQRDAAAKAEADKAAKAAKKAASVNVTQRGVLPSKPAQSGSMDETIRNTMREMGMI